MSVRATGRIGEYWSADALTGLRIVATCELPPNASCGGVDHVTWQVSRRLARQGAQICLVAVSPGTRGRSEEVDDGVRLVTVSGKDLSRILGGEAVLSAGLFREVRRAVELIRPQLLIANGLHFQGSVVAALLARRHRLPLVTTAHVSGSCNLSPPLRAALAGYEGTFGKFILRTSRHVIAVSDSVAAHVVASGVPIGRVTVVPNGVDLLAFSPGPVSSDSSAVPHILYVGRLVGNKGPRILVDALSNLRRLGRRFTAEFVGDGPLRTSLEAHVSRIGLDSVVRFVGHQADVASRLRKATILVRPSLTEGMPLAILEALAAQVCVVASRVDGTTELIEDGSTGLLFDPGSLDDLTAQLDRALADGPLRTRLSAAGRIVAMSHSWDRTATATAEVLLSALKPAGG